MAPPDVLKDIDPDRAFLANRVREVRQKVLELAPDQEEAKELFGNAQSHLTPETARWTGRHANIRLEEGQIVEIAGAFYKIKPGKNLNLPDASINRETTTFIFDDQCHLHIPTSYLKAEEII